MYMLLLYSTFFSTLFLLANPIYHVLITQVSLFFTHYISTLPSNKHVHNISHCTSSFGPIISEYSQFTSCFTCQPWSHDTQDPPHQPPDSEILPNPTISHNISPYLIKSHWISASVPNLTESHHISSNLTESHQVYQISMNFTVHVTRQISLNLTKSHHISLNHTKSHHILLILTKYQHVSPN